MMYNLKTHHWNLVLDLWLQASDRGQDVVIVVLGAVSFLRCAWDHVKSRTQQKIASDK